MTNSLRHLCDSYKFHHGQLFIPSTCFYLTSCTSEIIMQSQHCQHLFKHSTTCDQSGLPLLLPLLYRNKAPFPFVGNWSQIGHGVQILTKKVNWHWYNNRNIKISNQPGTKFFLRFAVIFLRSPVIPLTPPLIFQEPSIHRHRRTTVENWGWPLLSSNEKPLFPPISYKKTLEDFLMLMLNESGLNLGCWSQKKSSSLDREHQMRLLDVLNSYDSFFVNLPSESSETWVM